MNTTLEGIHSRITKGEAQINDLGDRMVEITASEQNIEKRMKRHGDSLMATHSSVLAWRIPGMGEPGGLPSMRSHRVRHD